MSTRKLNLAVYILTSVFAVSASLHAQTNTATRAREDLAATPLENVRIEAQSVGSLFSELSLSYGIPIGLETALNDDEIVMYRIDFKRGTLANLLTQFTAQHEEYSWEINDGVVNIFPKDNYRDVLSREMLETNVGSFSVKEKTSCSALAKSLVNTPEIKQVLEGSGATYRERGFTGTYSPQVGQTFTLEVSNATLKAILNKVIKESPTAKFWHIIRNSDDRTIFLGCSARLEGIQSKNEKPAVPQSNEH